MRRVLEQEVALKRRLRNQSELTRFQIFQAAVNEPRWCSARAGTKIGLVDDQAIDTLYREVAEQAGAVDARPDDQNVDIVLAEIREALLQIGGHAHRPKLPAAASICLFSLPIAPAQARQS